jgi:hypothetical protein
VANVAEENTLVDDDVGDIFVGGGRGSPIKVSFLLDMHLVVLLLVEDFFFSIIFFPFLSSSLSLSLAYEHLAIY